MRALLTILAARLIHAQEQVHLSLTGALDTMAIDFVVPAASTAVKVVYTGGSLVPDCKLQALNGYSAQWCTALMTGLGMNLPITYTISCDASECKPCVLALRPPDI